MNVARSGWRQCLLRTEAFEWQLGEVARQPSTQEGGNDYPTIECRMCSISASCRCNGGGHTHVQGRAASGDSTGGENISQPGLRSSEPPGFRSDARVCKFHAADHSVNARTASSRGFGCAAGFCTFRQWVWEGAAALTLPTTHAESVAESFAHW